MCILKEPNYYNQNCFLLKLQDFFICNESYQASNKADSSMFYELTYVNQVCRHVNFTQIKHVNISILWKIKPVDV